jgi:ATP-dependent DNA helicase RecQ
VSLLGYFGERLLNACGNCDNCLDPPRTFDGTVAAQKALSCVYRTGQRFGAAHLIDVLLGNSTDKVMQFGHQRLPTFGVGADIAEGQWRGIFRQLAAMGFLEVDLDGFGGLKLSPTSRAVLKGETRVTLRETAANRPKRRSTEQRSRERHAIYPRDATLWETLRATRAALAKEQGVPPYVIFHDTTLQDMLARRPTSLNEMREISGIGERKLARYGELFLKVLVENP